MKKTTEGTKITKKKKGDYTLSVSVNDVEYKGSGATMVDALTGFTASKDFPFSVKTRVVFKFSNGKKDGLFRQPTAMARRVFKMLSSKPSAVEILARKMEERLV